MVQVRNLQGQIVWTFPKGHIEHNETPIQAAFREVQEETGWKCGFFSGDRPRHFENVHYEFRRGPKRVKKKVLWFLMKPVIKTGKKDPEEILKVGWFSLDRSKEKAVYPSDKKLLKKLTRKI